MGADARRLMSLEPVAATRLAIADLVSAAERQMGGMDFSISPSLSRTLDLLRSLAAFLVVVNHVGEALFHFEDGLDLFNLFAFQLFYLGHQGVMILFVVSGFLVGRAAMQCIAKSGQGMVDYAVDRMTRIYVVLIPALVIGFLSDQILAHVYSGPEFSYVKDRTDLLIFMGNLVGLQTMFVPTFGSNGPLWSLACELWYYLMFPTFLLVIFGKGLRVRLVALVILSASLVTVSDVVLRYGVIWCLGLFCWLPRRRLAPKWLAWILLVCCLASANNEYLWSRGWGFTHIVATALCVALIINSCRHDQTISKAKAGAISKFFAKFTYSLYLYHYPPLMIVVAMTLKNNFVSYSHLGVAEAISAIGLLVLLYAYGFAFFWVTERHYHRFREFVRARIAPRRLGF